jgi:hypothetical protein
MLRRICLILSLFFMINAHSSERFFICGGDEDGCLANHPEFCICIPHNDLYENMPFCLDFDEMTCSPLATSPTCESSLVFKNQSTCLATLFQGQPEPPCTTTTRSFCMDNHSIMCPPDGRLSSCQ